MRWQASASPEQLRKRAAVLRQVRAFFFKRNVLEVETPILSHATVTDPYLDAMSTQVQGPKVKGSEVKGPQVPSRQMFLQTSPEYAMKRLLASGSGDIFQIAKCFRQDEIGKHHNPEFTMLEWYRTGFDMQALIDEVKALLIDVLAVSHCEQITYQSAFQRYLNIDPFNIPLEDLIALCQVHGLNDYCEQLRAHLYSDDALLSAPSSYEKAFAEFDETTIRSIQAQSFFDGLLQVLFSQCVESHLPTNAPVCITHFPKSQAALARLSEDGSSAKRFEVYYQGIELANGFEELTDANAQRRRFELDNLQRLIESKAPQTIDERFLAALEAGLPECSGVALGLDRLVMLANEQSTIAETLSFTLDNA